MIAAPDGRDPSRRGADARAPGCFAGLFGGAAPIAAARRRARLHGVRFCGVRAGHRAGRPESLPSSTFEGANVSLTYQHQWQHGKFGRSRQCRNRLFQRGSPAAESPWVNRWTVGARAGFNRQIGRRTTFSAAGNVGYSPYYGFGTIGQGASSAAAARSHRFLASTTRSPSNRR